MRTARAGGARGDPRAAHRRPLSLSWSRWYQAIVLADRGHEQGARGKNYEAPVRTPGSTSSNTWRWADVDTSSFDASSTSTRSGSVNQPLSEPWHKLCSQSSCCERTIRVTGPAARRLLGRRRDDRQQKHLRHNNIRARRGTAAAHRDDHRSRRVMAEDRRRVGRHWVRGAANEICCVRWISLMLITISSTCLTSCTRGLKVANPR